MIGVLDDTCCPAVASVPPGDMRITLPVLCRRMPVTHSARPADARARAGRSTRRRISVS
ncbi:hypothetical protein [Lentzea indica]|uniref:hypothetical protein n=1 Tax=Lentzea indica TaxID=2604800 RepID=UPI001FE65AFA|nr:hypothetical protein [Lentzea indica]